MASCAGGSGRRGAGVHGGTGAGGEGGKSGEALIRFNWGNKYSSFHAYNRNGKPRVAQNWYVAIKSALIQKKVA